MFEAQAVVFEDVRDVKVRTLQVPDPGPNDVVVRTRHSLISNGTESSFLRGERVGGDTPAKPGDKLPFPQVTGYQKVGIVEKAPENDPVFKPGQWVACTMSKTGLQDHSLGGHINPAVTDREQVYPLPEGMDPLEASGLVLTQVGYNCGMRPPVNAGATAVVIGDGMVGHWAAQTLQWRGASVVLVGKHDYRYKRFATRKEDRIVDVSATDDAREAICAACPAGINILVDTVGTNELIVDLFPHFCRNSHIVSAGFLGERGQIDIQMLRNRETTLHCPAGWMRPRMEETLRLLGEGVLRATPLITHHLPVNKAPEAFDMILNKSEEFLGIVLEWE